MKVEKWILAYRTREERKTILDDLDRPFMEIPNSIRYWRADPHLYKKDGKTWLFAELYDRVLLRGVLGCCELTESGAGKWHIILRLPFHLSYPHIFEVNNEMYMIPETIESREVQLYRASCFPYKWEYVKTIKYNCNIVDSTVCYQHDERYLMTYSYDNDGTKFSVAQMDDAGMLRNEKIIEKDTLHARPGGAIFEHQEKAIRPSQDCTEGYGCALNLNVVDQISSDGYSEHLLKKIKPSEIKTNCRNYGDGIHTYAVSDDFEVIDLKGYESRMCYVPGIFLGFIPRKILKQKYRKNK